MIEDDLLHVWGDPVLPSEWNEPDADGLTRVVYKLSAAQIDVLARGGTIDPRVPFTAPVAFQVPPFPLTRAAVYRWRAYVDGETRESWTLPFRTTPPKAPRT